MEKMLVHLFHSLPRQDCSLQDTGWCLVQPRWREVAGAALQELAPCPGVSLDFPKVGVFKASPGTVPSSWLSPEHLCCEGQQLGWSPLGAAVIRAARTCCPQQVLSLGAKPLVRTGLLTGVSHAWVSLVLTLYSAARMVNVSPWLWEGRDILQFPWLQTSDCQALVSANR